MSKITDYIQAQEIAIRAYGTSEGVERGWDTRGRGEHLDYEKTPPGGHTNVGERLYNLKKSGSASRHAFKGTGDSNCTTCGRSKGNQIHQDIAKNSDDWDNPDTPDKPSSAYRLRTDM